jgi:LysM repeat protein
MSNYGLTKPFFDKTIEIPQSILSSTPATEPPPVQTARKVKKALFFSLILGGASSLLFVPVLVSASLFGQFLGKTASPSSASENSYNSQTMPLLAAPVNADPRAAQSERAPTITAGEALVSEDNPVSPGDIETRPLNPQISVYVVRDGDTLSSVAAMFGITPNTIIGANGITNGVIRPGEELVILPITGIEHTVLKGETLTNLATKYGSDAHDIAIYNNLADGASLTVGNTIIIPNAEVSQPAVRTPQTTKQITTTQKITTTKTKIFTPAPLRSAGGPEYDHYYDWPLPHGTGKLSQGLHGYNGVDIAAPLGTPLYAAASGVVIIAKDNGAWNGGYGNYIVIAHSNGTQTLYAHASKVLVTEGQQVAQGEVIGKVGRTGEATGVHVHFEIRGATNPFGALPVGKGE